MLAESAPRPVVVRTDAASGGTDTSALSTLLLARLLPGLQERPDVVTREQD